MFTHTDSIHPVAGDKSAMSDSGRTRFTDSLIIPLLISMIIFVKMLCGRDENVAVCVSFALRMKICL